MKNTTQPVWQIAKKNELKGFYSMLENYPLDPTFLNYGGFIYPYDITEYSPEASKELKDEIKAKQDKNLYKLAGNYHTISWGLSELPDLTEKQAQKATKLIQKNIEGKEFQEALKSMYNCITIEKVSYFDVCLRYNKEWYLHTEIGGFIKLDSTKEEINAFLETVKNTDEPLKKAVKTKYRLKYCERYFKNSEEYKEFQEYHKTLNYNIGASSYQFQRYTKSIEKDLIDFTFKCTNRKIKLFVSTYTTFFKQIDPIY